MPEEQARINMGDGVRLAVSLYLPETSPPWPAVLEALPYRKDDVTFSSYAPEYRRLRDEGGYAVARVDLRGTGSSEGLAADEYLRQEQEDLCAVIAWLAGRDWCTGAVGMYGTSYSGFNAIQVAMEKPPALKAIIAIYATDDRYTDDVHYAGGARRALDFADYPTYMVALNALPPWPGTAGEGWRERWRDRVERLEPWLLRWLEEQVDGPYWRHGSLRPEYDRIECPTMIVGGWADGYRNAAFRTFERLGVPKRLVMGPWSHMSTETSLPGPHIDLVPEMIRWWDRWLRGADNGVDRQPPIAVFVRRSTRPAYDLPAMRGSWRHEASWPIERGREWALLLDEAVTLGRQSGEGEDKLEVRPDVGWTASISCAAHLPFGQPGDQRPDEAFSLVYDWPALADDVEILGFPRLEVEVRSSAPVAFVSAKLCDVFEDGTSALVSRGFMNLTHRRSDSAPEALVPGEPYQVTLELDATSWVFERGHRVRLDLAGTDWPNAWPPPEPVALTVQRAGSRLILPRVDGPPSATAAVSFALPASERSGDQGAHPPEWKVEHDLLRRETRVVISHGSDEVVETGARTTERYGGVTGVSTDDIGTAWAEGSASFAIEWPDVTVESRARTRLDSDRTGWRVSVELDVEENGERRWSRRWERRFPRQLG